MRPWLKRTLQITGSVLLLVAAGLGAIFYSVVGGKMFEDSFAVSRAARG